MSREDEAAFPPAGVLSYSPYLTNPFLKFSSFRQLGPSGRFLRDPHLSSHSAEMAQPPGKIRWADDIEEGLPHLVAKELGNIRITVVLDSFLV